MRTANPYDNLHAVNLANAWVKAHTKITPGLCDHYAGVLFGWGHTGEVTAAQHFADIPDSYKHGTDPAQAIAGRLAFYTERRAGGAGHVALVVAGHDPRNIVIASTDLPRSGLFTHQLVTAPVTDWGLRFLGYTSPLFPNGLSPAHTPLYRVV